MTSSSSSSLNMSSEANLDDKVDFLMTKVSSIPLKNLGDLRVYPTPTYLSTHTLFDMLQKALEDIGMSGREIFDVLRIVAAVLKLGNVEFVPTTNMDGTEGCAVSNDYGNEQRRGGQGDRLRAACCRGIFHATYYPPLSNIPAQSGISWTIFAICDPKEMHFQISFSRIDSVGQFR